MRAYILCKHADHFSLYTSWWDRLPIPYEVINEHLESWQPPDDAAIVISHCHYRWNEVHTLRSIYEANRVPVLILADGILEYRNLFDHPDLADGCIFQPTFGHKLACLGRGQIRVLESWGNVGKCESVGLPRLDVFLGQSPSPIHKQGPFRLLIATATTPAFTSAQRTVVLEALGQLKQKLEHNPWVNGRRLEVNWRLTDNLDFELDIAQPPARGPRPTLSQAIDAADAVLTTPSTIYLEAALKKRPTALLDFHNVPHYVPSAWMINAPKHTNQTLSELANPPGPKMLYQEMVLADQLECQTPAAPRMIELIMQMVEAGQRCRAAQQPLTLPARILTDSMHGFSSVSPEFDLRQLYPNNEVFQRVDSAKDQVELNLANQRLTETLRLIDELKLELSLLKQNREELLEHVEECKQRITATRARVQHWKRLALAHDNQNAGQGTEIEIDNELDKESEDEVNSKVEKTVDEKNLENKTEDK